MLPNRFLFFLDTNTKFFKLRLVCSRARFEDQLLYAKFYFGAPLQFRLVLITSIVLAAALMQSICPIGFVLSHNFKNLLRQNGDKCCVIKVLLFAFFFCNHLVGSQLFRQIGFSNKFGSQKKMAEKHCN